MALTQITRARAEELVHELIQTGEVETTRAQDWVEDLVKTSRERSDTLLSTVRGEVRHQLADLGITNMDDLVHRVAEMLDQAETAARRATRSRPRSRPGHQPARRPGPPRPRRPRPARPPAKKAPAKAGDGQEDHRQGQRHRHQGQEGAGPQGGGHQDRRPRRTAKKSTAPTTKARG